MAHQLVGKLWTNILKNSGLEISQNDSLTDVRPEESDLAVHPLSEQSLVVMLPQDLPAGGLGQLRLVEAGALERVNQDEERELFNTKMFAHLIGDVETPRCHDGPD